MQLCISDLWDFITVRGVKKGGLFYKIHTDIGFTYRGSKTLVQSTMDAISSATFRKDVWVIWRKERKNILQAGNPIEHLRQPKTRKKWWKNHGLMSSSKPAVFPIVGDICACFHILKKMAFAFQNEKIR